MRATSSISPANLHVMFVVLHGITGAAGRVVCEWDDMISVCNEHTLPLAPDRGGSKEDYCGDPCVIATIECKTDPHLDINDAMAILPIADRLISSELQCPSDQFLPPPIARTCDIDKVHTACSGNRPPNMDPLAMCKDPCQMAMMACADDPTLAAETASLGSTLSGIIQMRSMCENLRCLPEIQPLMVRAFEGGQQTDHINPIPDGVCCTPPGVCQPDKLPTACSAECAAEWNPVWQECQVQPIHAVAASELTSLNRLSGLACTQVMLYSAGA
jgi:hypothetical protein